MNDITSSRPSRRKRPRSHRDSQNVISITQTAVLVLLLLACVALLLTGLRMANAGIAAYQAEAFLTDWAGKRVEPDSRAWAVAYSAAQRSIDSYPVANGEYFDRLGRIHSWQFAAQPFASPLAKESRLAAVGGYRAAIAARPVWPYSWLQLADSKLHLAQFDAEFKRALGRAMELGPTRIDVQREVARIAFSAWPQLNASERQRFLESARRSVAYGPREAQQLYALASSHGVADALCASLDSHLKTTRKLCQ